MLGWWNGIHERLKIFCRKACGFESRPEHNERSELCSGVSQLFGLRGDEHRERRAAKNFRQEIFL